jgi:anti-sigma factor RsiW
MTDPIKPHELSGLLDGELTLQREKEIRRMMEEDAGLRAEFERLQRFDKAWSTAASQAAFQPDIILPPQGMAQAWWLTRLVPALCVLLAARLLPKLDSTFMLSVTVHAMVMLLVIAALIRVHGMADAPPVSENSNPPCG